MKCITVCVNYDDILALTLPHNGEYFEEILIVTSPDDDRTLRLIEQIKEVFEFNVKIHQTDAFSRHGAHFNKGLALEEGFDKLGREGWTCVLDADIVIPESLECSEILAHEKHLAPKKLHTPHRVQCRDAKTWNGKMDDWAQYVPVSDVEHAGYCQIFHAKDPVLSTIPWYGTHWTHAGGCDSDFQAKWGGEDKVWLAFEVLHLGPFQTNWFGRVTDRIDGEIDMDTPMRHQALCEMHRNRMATGGYQGERI